MITHALAGNFPATGNVEYQNSDGSNTGTLQQGTMPSVPFSLTDFPVQAQITVNEPFCQFTTILQNIVDGATVTVNLPVVIL